jgi:hypothetical protein
VLISFRIWSVDLAAGRYRGPLRPILIVVLESGTIHSTSLIVLLATYLAGSSAQYLVFESVSQTNCITYILPFV